MPPDLFDVRSAPSAYEESPATTIATEAHPLVQRAMDLGRALAAYECEADKLEPRLAAAVKRYAAQMGGRWELLLGASFLAARGKTAADVVTARESEVRDD